MERMSPRTATIDEVTSTAQIAIWTTSNTSRTVIRRPNAPVDPALTISYGLARRIWRTGTIPNRTPLTNAKTNATSTDAGSAFLAGPLNGLGADRSLEET